MALYYKNRPSATLNPSSQADDPVCNSAPALSEFDIHRESLLSDDSEEGWASELRRYLGNMERDVKKDTDIVEWWQVSNLSLDIVTRAHHLIGPCPAISNDGSDRT
jgi:hypothetical protein